MKQICHTWIALRAIGLIEDDPKTKNLAKILAPWAIHSYAGCWLPDMTGFKKGHGIVGNHTFKNTLYSGANESRFVLPKNKLLKGLDTSLALYEHLNSSAALEPSWWDKPYKADQKEGEHLPDCLSSLFDTITDMLLLGDEELDGLVPGVTGYSKSLHSKCAIRKEQAAIFFFILSHYIADSFMPCHADKRKLAAFKTGGAHEGWEKHWEKKIGKYFEKTNLAEKKYTSRQILDKARELDEEFGLSFKTPLTWPDNKNDIWDTAIFWCRASFAFSCEIFPIGEYGFDSEEELVFKDYFSDPEKLAEYDRIVLQSAVYAVASTWKQIWRKFKE